MVEVAPDGRVVRGARNREAIADAVLSLYEDGVLRPSINDVAQRAGVSARSVHNHFADIEALRAEVADRQWQRLEHLIRPLPNDLPLGERIRQLVAGRAVLYEKITPVRRAALLSVHDSPTIARRLGALGRRLRAQVATLFEVELADGDETTLDALDLCTSWDAWERLRTQQRLSTTAAKNVVASMLEQLLTKG